MGNKIERLLAMNSHLLTLRDLAEDDLEWILSRGVSHASGGARRQTLRDRLVGLYFTAPSTRTRTAFSAAALRLGADVVAFGAQDLQVSTGESFADTGRVLGRMLDALVIRTAGVSADIDALARQREMAIINAMSADEHPTQALSDVTFLLSRFPSHSRLRIVYVGEGNNTAAALCLLLARRKRVEVHFRTPRGYGIPAAVAQAAKLTAVRSGAQIDERHDLAGLPEEIDVVYTTQWQTTGTTKSDPDWRAQFEPFRVTRQLIARYPDSIFMHDLPAHRGEEVAAEVIDGNQSVVFDQAAFKMFSAMAVLEWAILDAGARLSPPGC